MAQVCFSDHLIKEYLVFRGFPNTLKTLDNELKNEKDQNFRSEKIIEQFNQLIQTHDLNGIRTLWMHLDSNLFSKLEHSFAAAVKKLENSLLKLYLVTVYSSGKIEKVFELFNKFGTELLQQSDWKDWFYFPFCKNAEESPMFAIYFSKQWQDTWQISLRNFLTTVYQCLPQPTFVRAEHEALHIRRLQEENSLLKNKLQQLQLQLLNSNQNSNTIDCNIRKRLSHKPLQNLSEILPFDVSPPSHVVDDFCIIATEANNVTQASDAQARGLKLLIKNIGIGNSPIMGRKESSEKTIKRRSGSVGRNWI